MQKTTQKIPATVVTGFLGAGKTTLIRHLLAHAEGRRLALIINEFGDVGIDGEILKACGEATCGEDDILELANGCICCTVADDFLPTIENLLARPNPPDHIVIETSGLALPKPLVKAFTWPGIRTRTTVDGVVVLLDADAVAAGRFATDEAALAAARAADPTLDHDNPIEELYEDQLACADLVILNKADLVDAATLARIDGEIRAKVRAGVGIAHATHGKVAASILLGIDAQAEDDLAARPSHHDAEDGHDHDDFDSFVVTGGPAASPQALAGLVGRVMAAHGILRVKGFVQVAGSPARLVVQAVGPRVEHYFDRPWRSEETRRSALVVIGEKGLDRAAISAALAAGLQPD